MYTRCRRASDRDFMKYSMDATIIDRPSPVIRI